MHLGLRGTNNSKSDHSSGTIRSVDALVYTTSVLALIFTFDQIRIVWIAQDASGVSLLTWLMYALSWFTLLVYSNVHRDTFLSIASFVGVLQCALIVVGTILFD